MWLRYLLLAVLMVSCHVAQAASLYLVRHAEKHAGENPELTQQGHQRAQRLASLFSTTDLDVIYSTDYHRTRQTAQPMAAAKNLQVNVYDPKALTSLAEQLLADNKNAVIIGHSNTTPQLVRLLSNQAIPDMDEQTYHLIYQVITFPDHPDQPAVVNVFSSQ